MSEPVNEDLSGQLSADLDDTEKGEGSRFKNKHSLDSDEEDNCNNYDLLDEDDIEGQEDDTIQRDGQTSITPFNMKEEMEEGHFDSAGTYIFKKEKEIQDHWMDNIDWVKLTDQEKNAEDMQNKLNAGETLGAESDDEENVNEIDTYRKMVELMKPGESVVKSIKRLGGGGKSSHSSASQRWSQKRKNQKNTTKTEPDKGVDKEGMLRLTEYADVAMRHFNTEIYQDTYECLSFKIQHHDKESASKAKRSNDALDMFADEPSSTAKRVKFDTDDKQSKSNGEESEKKNNVEEKQDKDCSAVSEVRWEYKWEDKEDSDIHGPFTSEEMVEWVDNDYFPKGVFVRKVGVKDAPFYNSKRVDFELYT